MALSFDLKGLLVDTLALNMRQLRKARGWSQERLASELGVNRVSIARYETAQGGVPDWEFIIRLADTFGVTTEDLRRPMSEQAVAVAG